MSNLNHYVRQLRPRTESYIDPVDRIQDLLSEANTDSADVNEIMFGYYVAGTWGKFVDSTKAQQQLELKKGKIGQKAYDSQDEKAKAMADEVIDWSKKGISQKHIVLEVRHDQKLFFCMFVSF